MSALSSVEEIRTTIVLLEGEEAKEPGAGNSAGSAVSEPRLDGPSEQKSRSDSEETANFQSQ
jgi:hypothetical protein